MAGKPKKKLDYAGWNTDIFENEPKIDKLLDRHGWNGFAIYFYLCQRAYGSDGYYYRWSYDDSASTARKMGCGISSSAVRETVATCLQIGLFDKGSFDRCGVLTSRGIQKKYWLVASERTDRSVIDELWLLNDDECRGCLKVTLKSDSQPENGHSTPSTSHVQPLKESKVKESKGKDTKTYSSVIADYTLNSDLRTALQNFVAMRNKMKGFTVNALELGIKKLNTLATDDLSKIEIVNQSIERSWKGFFPLKQQNAYTKRQDVLPDYYEQMKNGEEKETAEVAEFNREEFEEIRRKLKEQEKK